jgi:hypothetical protein
MLAQRAGEAAADLLLRPGGEAGLEMLEQNVELPGLASFGHFLRLRVRCERLADIHDALLKTGATLMCWNYIRSSFCHWPLTPV